MAKVFYLSILPYDLQNEFYSYVINGLTPNLELWIEKNWKVSKIRQDTSHEDRNYRNMVSNLNYCDVVFDLSYCDVASSMLADTINLLIWKRIVNTYVSTFIDVGKNWKAWRNLYYVVAITSHDIHYDIAKCIKYGFDVLLTNLLVKLLIKLNTDPEAKYGGSDVYQLIKASLSSHFHQIFQIIYDYCESNGDDLQKFIKYTIQGAIRGDNIMALRYITSKGIDLEDYISMSDYEDINETLATFLSEQGIIFPTSLYLNTLDRRNRYKGFDSFVEGINKVLACDFK